MSGLRDKKIVIFGFGSQGRVQALNLRDGGLTPTICLPPSSAKVAAAQKEGFEVIVDPARAAALTEIAVILTPDAIQPALYRDTLDKHLPPKAMMIFAHGFNLHYELIRPRKDLKVVLVAPQGHADLLRDSFRDRLPFLAILALAPDSDQQVPPLAKEYAEAIGCTDTITTTLREEVETDLFAEQAVLCGGLFELARAGAETLIAAGYSPEITRSCCIKELKGLATLLHNYGIEGSLERISDTARYGAITRGPRVISPDVRREMKKILAEIQNGSFFQELKKSSPSGGER